MKVIALVSQKGGAGKSTLAISLAVAAVLDQRSAALIDLDPQASAVAWSHRREVEAPAVVPTTAGRLVDVVARAESAGADLVVIDTAPRAAHAARAAAALSELVVAPVRPEIADLETVPATMELIRSAGNCQVVAVINGSPPRGSRRDQAADVLEELSVSVCPQAIGARTAFVHASATGLSVQEYDPRGKAAAEILRVYLHIRRLVGL